MVCWCDDLVLLHHFYVMEMLSLLGHRTYKPIFQKYDNLPLCAKALFFSQHKLSYEVFYKQHIFGIEMKLKRWTFF